MSAIYLLQCHPSPTIKSYSVHVGSVLVIPFLSVVHSLHCKQKGYQHVIIAECQCRYRASGGAQGINLPEVVKKVLSLGSTLAHLAILLTTSGIFPACP